MVLEADLGGGLQGLDIGVGPFLLLGPGVVESLNKYLSLTTPALGAALTEKFQSLKAASPEGVFLSYLPW